MKIAITAKGPDLDAEVDPRFGRAAWIIIVNPSSLEFEAIDNSANANAFKGAGIQAATLVHDKGAEALLTGFCGPNAFKVLESAGVKVANDVTGTVRQAVAAFNEGRITFTDRANVEGHW
ncbi:MAG: dinitrogenase iron-molybdenum cofactor biosynthesis protein [Desulfococcus sp. 4484_241]|nr:MAG: dinitrogenase iron-molybdenum cofactor biosynthesis protein [Desulfococcus sp. 4484_241]RLC28725.1 MAG: dinitrogenase iron-molybdenum cofactor biosynthesis protein [Deltaproteobacteria bacterium]